MMAMTTSNSIRVKPRWFRAVRGSVHLISIGRLLGFGPVNADGRPFVTVARQHDEQASAVGIEQAGAGQLPGWDPFGDGKTSIRSGFGLFFDPVWTDFYANAGNRLAPFYTLGSIRNPVFPRAETLVGNPGFVLGRQDVLVYEPRNPYNMQYNLTVQRQLASASVLTVSYAGQRGLHLARFIDGNQAIPQILADGRKFFPESSVTRNPNLTGVRYKVTDG